MNITEEFVNQLIKQNEQQAVQIATLSDTVTQLTATIKELNKTIKELEEKLNKNSKNSSKPPSSDGLKKPNRKTSLRMIKTKTKVSGCFRTEDGIKNYLTVMFYIGTAKKNGKNAYEAIQNIFEGNPNFVFE